MTKNNGHTAFTEQNFDTEVIKSDRPVLVDFSADWCAPCRAIAPIVDKLADNFKGRATVGMVDVDADSSLAERFGIRSIPSLLFFRNGEVVDRATGVVSQGELTERLEHVLEQP